MDDKSERKYTNRRYLDALENHVLIFDGAMGTSIQSQKLTREHYGGKQYEGCIDYLVISYPEAVEKVHRSFLEAGVDVIETNTFRSNRITLQEYGLSDRAIEINQAAAVLARCLVDEYSQPSEVDVKPHPRFVAGSIGPSGKLPSADDPELSNISFDELSDVFREQAIGLIQGGVDLLLIETSQDILETKAAITGIYKAFEESSEYLPIQAQITLDTSGRMLLGTDITAALAILEGLGVDVIGLNCSTGPDHMRDPIRYLGENAPMLVSCVPNAGLPLNVDGEAVYPMEPEAFANAMVEFVNQNNISIVGGCCGTTPEHLKLLVEKLKGTPTPQRPFSFEPQLSSSIHAIPMHQVPSPLIIGERCNAQGSRKFKRLLLAEDYDAIVEIARGQVEGGAHTLDVSVAVTERPDEIDLMRKVVKKLALAVDVPLVIDTTEPDVMEAALKTAPGRFILNSTHLESGREKADRIFKLAKVHNATVLCLTIDEHGMAKTAQTKLDIARRLYSIAINEHGLRPEDLIFDTLTFTLATGDAEYSNSAMETIEGIRLIKEELPGVLTSLGVSNISFGLSPVARPVLNSIMLYHAVQAGLDVAIVNPAQITPYAEIPIEERKLTEDLIFNRHPEALQRFIEFYEKVERPSIGESLKADPTEGMTPQARLHWRVLHRHKEGVEADIDEIIAMNGQISKHETAVSILNNVLLPAMKEVGDKFGAGELILPFVLQSAEVMKKAVTHLEGYLEKKAGITKGVVVLATVYGDVHDIGKNLVKTILSNNGYTVIDLGKQVPAEAIIAKAVEVNADAIGLSALLVNTSRQMPLIVSELHQRDLKIPVLIGGAAINRRFGWRTLFPHSDEIYEAGVFYCKDAFEGLATMDTLMNPDEKPGLLKKLRDAARGEMRRELSTTKVRGDKAHSGIKPAAIRLPSTQEFGARVVRHMPLEIIFQHLFINELFRLSWGAKNAHDEEWERLQTDFKERLDKMKSEAMRTGWLNPQAVYGYWPAASEGDDLIIYNPEGLDVENPIELMRFTFPRQRDGARLCLADYFAPVGSGKVDVVAFQIVTVGKEATQRFEKLQEAGDYSEAYYTHGLAVQTAEATAEYLHQHIRKELGIPVGQGKRYSWGYPAIPELEDHRKVFDLLPAERELAMSLTPAYQLVPEQSTAAIIVHHPEASYFNIGKSRVEQLIHGEKP